MIVIDRNGLRCFSNTKLMNTGKRFGDGIYFSDSFPYSALYATDIMGSQNHWMNGMYKQRLFVVGLFEVISSPSIREEADQFTFVVPKEHEENVALRYLIVHDQYHLLSHEEKIVDGHILSYGDHNVDLSQHYERITQKYASAASCSK